MSHWPRKVNIEGKSHGGEYGFIMVNNGEYWLVMKKMCGNVEKSGVQQQKLGSHERIGDNGELTIRTGD